MRPAQALDRHGQLLDILESSAQARDLVNMVAGSSLRMQRTGKSVSMREMMDSDDPPISPTLINHLRAAETFHIDKAMVPLLMKRSAELRDTSQFGEYPPPTGCGLLVFDEPMSWVEAGGRVEYVHMVLWGPAQFRQARNADRLVYGTIVVLWNDAHRDEDGVTRWLLGKDEEAWAETLAWTHGILPTVVLGQTSELRIGPAMLPTEDERRQTLAEEGLTAADEAPNPVRMVCAAWKLLDETIAKVEPDQHVERHFRRRAERRGIKPRVTVVTLRRTDAHGVEGARGPLEERHDVRGHWRSYWVGSGENRHKERRWISLHESPKNPLLPKAAPTQKVYTLKR